MSLPNPFNTLQAFTANGTSHKFYSVPALEKAGFNVSRLPVSIRLVLESLLRNCDGKRVAEPAVRALASWKAKEARTEEIPFVVARIVLQDFTGVPLLVDLAAMRSAVTKLGKNPKIIEPLVPVDLVVDHSVQVDFAGSAEALKQNLELEFSRNRERYQFLKWGMQAFDTFKVVPPGIGIVHQVNLEYLAKGVLEAGGVYYPDTLVGTDSHTTMINGLGIVGWGVGGIEAEAAMLGQPMSMLIPEVVGFELTGSLQEGTTATDLVLTVTEKLRKKGVDVSKVRFVNIGSSADVFRGVIVGTLDAGFGETGIIETAERLKVRPVEGGNLSTDLTEYTFQGAWASDRVVETKRDAMTRTLAAYAKLYRFVHKAEAKDAFMKAYAGALKSGTTEDAESMWTFVQKYKPYAENLVLTPERIRYMQQLNVDTEVQKAVLPFERVADMSVAQDALKLI